MNHMNDQMGMHDISIISIENSILGGENFQQKFYRINESRKIVQQKMMHLKSVENFL